MVQADLHKDKNTKWFAHRVDKELKSLEKMSFNSLGKRTSTGQYKSCAALAYFSGTFELIVEEGWFGLV